jgi:hypothetical protein
MLFSDDKLAFWTLETWFFAFGTCDLLAGHPAGLESPTENGVLTEYRSPQVTSCADTRPGLDSATSDQAAEQTPLGVGENNNIQ